MGASDDLILSDIPSPQLLVRSLADAVWIKDADGTGRIDLGNPLGAR